MGKKNARSGVRGGKVIDHEPEPTAIARKVKGVIVKATKKTGSKYSKGIVEAEIIAAATTPLASIPEVTAPVAKAENITAAAKGEITPAAPTPLATTSEVTSPVPKAGNGNVDGKKEGITPSFDTYLASLWELKDLVSKNVKDIYEGMLVEDPPHPATGTEVEKFKRPCIRAVRSPLPGKGFVRSGRYHYPKPAKKGFRPLNTGISVCDAGDQVRYSNGVARI